MKRDMDLVRQILLETEKIPFLASGQVYEPEIEGYSHEEISYHVKLLQEAGYVQAMGGDAYWVIQSLTWEGHEFLEASKDDTRWNKAKSIMKDKGGGMVFDVLKQLLITLMKDAVFK